MKNLDVIICAAGSSVRMGFDKLLFEINGKTVVEKSMRAFDLPDLVHRIILAVSPARVGEFERMFSDIRLSVETVIVPGGGNRADSVCNALRYAAAEYVAVHDAARPFVTEKLIRSVYDCAKEHSAAVPVIPVTDTIHVAEKDRLISTPEREALKAAQTPQIFQTELLKMVLEQVSERSVRITDDGGACIECGIYPGYVAGDIGNIKLTNPNDITAYQKERKNTMRIGHGYDVHRLVQGRKLILGGVEIPFEKGLLGHSDADVLLHAIADALLGAAALGDIGKHFPDTDDQYKGISSLILLARTAEKIRDCGFEVENIDATVVAQRPKLLPYIETMRQNIAEVLRIPVGCVNVKATTEEQMGFTGSGEGISAHCVSLLKNDEN